MERQDGREISGAGKFALGTVAGGLASAVSTPVEVSMVRMYADGTRGRYRHIFDALFQIARDEGLRGLWRGATPTIMRSALANCVQLGTYDHAKHLFMNNIERARDDVPVHLAASATSGFCYSVATLPIDMAKTRLQEQGGGRGVRYGGVFECVWRVGREEGIAALWKGFVPYFSRCAGHTVAMFLVLEQVKKIL